MSDLDDESYDLYDEVANLEKWQEILADSIANNTISQQEFDDEMLKTNYYLDLKTKTYVLDEDDQEIINKLRMYKASLTENYKMGILSEEQFNIAYLNTLRKEYEILKLSETEIEEGPSTKVKIDLPLEEKLKELHENEIKYNKIIAKKYNIPYPKLPRGIKKQDVEIYHDLKIDGKIGPSDFSQVIEDFLDQMSAFKKLVGYYSSSYEITGVFYDIESGKAKTSYKTIAPISDTVLSFKKLEKRSNLLTPEEQLYSDRLNTLKSNLRELSREELLKCVGVRTYKYMTYIQRLKENKQKVLKFREHPENYEMLKLILKNENTDHYKIDSNELFKDYTFTHPDVLESFIDETPADLTEYVQSGNISYLAIKPGSDLNDLGMGLENFVTVKPLPDPLYEKLTAKNGTQTETGDVWVLRQSLPGTTKRNITKRYLSFEDYLTDLKDILVQNSKNLTGKSKDLINNKIRKINFYLKYNEDLENYTSTSQMPVSDIFKNASEIYTMRKNGVYKLMSYISLYYPGSQILVERLEADTFDFSSGNYNFNIDKLIFLFKNYQNKLEDLVEGRESIVNMLSYEVPQVLPEDDIDLDDKQGTIDRILLWNPDTTEFDKYKSELESNGYKFYKFKKDHPEITNLEISNIMSQYSESLLWERSKERYAKLKVPSGTIEMNYRLRFILRERNRLPSRRIFRVANVYKRIQFQKELKSVFIKCKIPEPDEYSILTENIIFGMAKTPELYDYYFTIVKDNYTKLCSYFTKVNLNCRLDSEGNVKCIIAFQPNVLTPVITEFLITEGDFKTVDISRLIKFTEGDIDGKTKDYLLNLRGDEIKAYVNSYMSEVNKDKQNLNTFLMRTSRAMLSKNYQDRLESLRNVVYNTYKPPIVSNIKPVKIRMGIEFIQKHVKVGENYIYGGFFPPFNNYTDVDNITENYTRNDLEQLATIYEIEYMGVESFELYKKIITLIDEYDRQIIINEEPIYNPSDYNYYSNYLNVPQKTIHYTIRPRLGVQEPGEAYAVIRDDEKVFGVPFKFNKDSIPVYSNLLKPLIADGFIIVEGPSIFEDTNINERLTSNYYINIEYLNSRGKPILFREGVASKKVIKRKEDKLESCSRFTNELTCNHVNSYSLDLKGIKYKCQWLKKYIMGNEVGECKGIGVFQNPEIEQFDITDVTFEDTRRQELWKEAIQKSIDYIENIVKLKDISKEEINVLLKEQKIRLFDYYKVLLKSTITDSINQAETTTSDTKIYNLVEEFPDILKPDRVPTTQIVYNDSDYKQVTIYKQEIAKLNLPLKIILGKEYTVSDLKVIPREYIKLEKSYLCTVVETGEDVLLEPEMFRKKSSTLTTKTVPVFCVVHKDNYDLLFGFKNYSWALRTEEFTRELDILNKREITETKTFIPLNLITPSDVLNDKPLITRDDIFNAMILSAFSILTTNDNMIFTVIDKFNAQNDAILFCLKNNFDIQSLRNSTIGTITLSDVLEKFEDTVFVKSISKQELIDAFEKAIREKDANTIIKYFVKAKKLGIDKELLKQAKDIIKEKDKEPEPIKEEVKTESKPTTSRSNIYTSSRRRR